MKRKHGGARKGAGRKPNDQPVARISVTVPFTTMLFFDAIRKRKDKNRSEAVSEAMMLWMKKYSRSKELKEQFENLSEQGTKPSS